MNNKAQAKKPEQKKRSRPKFEIRERVVISCSVQLHEVEGSYFQIDRVGTVVGIFDIDDGTLNYTVSLEDHPEVKLNRREEFIWKYDEFMK